MKETELIQTNKGFDLLVDKNLVLTMSKDDAVNSFDLFGCFTKESIPSIKKITFKKKNDD